MLERDNNGNFSALMRLSVVAIVIMVLAVGTAAAQDPVLAAPQSPPGTSAIPLGDYSVTDCRSLRSQAQKAVRRR